MHRGRVSAFLLALYYYRSSMSLEYTLDHDAASIESAGHVRLSSFARVSIRVVRQ